MFIKIKGNDKSKEGYILSSRIISKVYVHVTDKFTYREINNVNGTNCIAPNAYFYNKCLFSDDRVLSK